MSTRNISGFSVMTPRSLALSPTIERPKEFDEFFPGPVILVPLRPVGRATPLGDPRGPKKKLGDMTTHGGSGIPELAPSPPDTFNDAVIIALVAAKGEPGRVTIGRGIDEEVMVPVLSVSRKQGAFAVTAAGSTYTDRGSSNGSWVRGAAVLPNQPVRLANGDEIALGPTVRVLFLEPAGLRNMVLALRRA
jgi:hypothetical protein